MKLYLGARLLARLLQPRIGLWPSFARTWLHAVRPVAHCDLGNECHQQLDTLQFAVAHAVRGPLCPQLRRMLEAQLTWMNRRRVCSLRHQQPDHVVSEQMNRSNDVR
jgi:hypothetical protein